MCLLSNNMRDGQVAPTSQCAEIAEQGSSQRSPRHPGAAQHSLANLSYATTRGAACHQTH